VSEVIDSARKLIQARLLELEEEAKSLQQALASLGESAATPRRRPGRPPKRATGKAVSTPRRKRRAGSKAKGARAPRGQRREQFLTALAKSPGAKASEIAKQLGISANQAHTLARRLHQQKAIRKSGKGYRVAAKAKS
jgi:IclR helix-turn-helix domain